MKRIIYTDAFNIVKRLKQIDKAYFVVFDTIKKELQVHAMGQKNTFCFSVPNQKLDYRVLTYANKSKIKNIKKLLKDINSFNQKQERIKEDIQKNDTNLLFNRYYCYLNNYS